MKPRKPVRQPKPVAGGETSTPCHVTVDSAEGRLEHELRLRGRLQSMPAGDLVGFASVFDKAVSRGSAVKGWTEMARSKHIASLLGLIEDEIILRIVVGIETTPAAGGNDAAGAT